MHTPGLLVDYLATSSGIAIRANTGAIVAVVKHTPTADMVGSEAERFAHLFAAAPELLKCAEMLAALDSGRGRTFPTEEDCAFARAIIAKAKGGAL